jgi:hypothetical protein
MRGSHAELLTGPRFGLVEEVLEEDTEGDNGEKA